MSSVLIVEDDKFLAELVGRILTENAEIQVSHTDSLRETFKFDLNQFGCIVLDLNIADSAGPKTFTKVHEKTKSPIIVLTGESEDVGLKLIGKGAEDFIQKPVAKFILLKAVIMAIKRYEYKNKVDQVYQMIRSLDDVNKNWDDIEKNVEVIRQEVQDAGDRSPLATSSVDRKPARTSATNTVRCERNGGFFKRQRRAYSSVN